VGAVWLGIFLQLIGSVLVFKSGLLSPKRRRRFRLDQPPPDTGRDEMGLAGGVLLAIGAGLQWLVALVG
jgi:hypothetical protein